MQFFMHLRIRLKTESIFTLNFLFSVPSRQTASKHCSQMLLYYSFYCYNIQTSPKHWTEFSYKLMQSAGKSFQVFFFNPSLVLQSFNASSLQWNTLQLNTKRSFHAKEADLSDMRGWVC